MNMFESDDFVEKDASKKHLDKTFNIERCMDEELVKRGEQKEQPIPRSKMFCLKVSPPPPRLLYLTHPPYINVISNVSKKIG